MMYILFYLVGFVLTISFIDKLYSILPDNKAGNAMAMFIIFCPVVNITTGFALLLHWWFND